MKQRVISALVGLVLLGVIVLFYDTAIFTLAITLLILLAVYELLNATKLIKYKVLVVIATGFSLLLPVAQLPIIRPYIPLFVFALSVAFFISVLLYYSQLSFEKMSMGLLFSIFVPLFLGSAVYLRDDFGTTVGLYYLFLALGSAWFCDTGAYFSGYFFGKTKMAPVISPKKTIEGAVGGVISTIILNVLLAYLFQWFYAKKGIYLEFNFIVLGCITPFLAVLGMVGDLIASVIKRQNNVKDYGHIMPGHGGVMDRFDSVLLTLPAVYILMNFFPIIR